MTPLPAAPQRDQDPATFATTADTFVAALPGFVTEANALEAAVDADATTATTQAGIATTQAGIATTQASNALASANAADVSEANALASANAAALSESNAATSASNASTSASNAANYAAALRATSTTNITIGTGSKVFTTQTGKQFVAGQYVQAISGSNWLFGTVTSYVTDQLTINVTATNGSGSFASWDIVLSGIQGIQGIQGIAGATTLFYSGRTSNTQITNTDAGYLIDITSGTFTQTFAAAATLGSGFYCYIRNSGTGDITLDPDGAETIDGLTSYVMYPSEVRLVQCDGSSLRSVVIQPFSKTITVTSNFIKPPGYSQFGGAAWSAGASGARSNNTGGLSRGGGGGMCFHFQIPSSSFGSSETITIGAGGVAYTGTSGTTHNAGGNTTIGALLTVLGATGNSGAGFGTAATTPVGFEGSTGVVASASATYGGGGCNNTPAANSSPSRFGGGGGGGCDTAGVAYLGGVSNNGGSGGNASSASNGADGVAPGGGGGATQTGTQSGAGARGEVRIWGLV